MMSLVHVVGFVVLLGIFAGVAIVTLRKLRNGLDYVEKQSLKSSVIGR